MALTQAQLQTLATDIANNTNQTIIDALAVGNNNAIRDWYNSEASPAFYLWRTSMSTSEIRDQHVDWSEFVGALTTNTMLAFAALTQAESIDPSRGSIRAAFQEIFSGPQTENTRNALVAAAKRLATYVQKLFADTSGGDGRESTPATAVVESITLQDVRDAVAIINAG